MTATTWTGARGPMLLGPTEDRVARYLAELTRHGRIRIRTVELAARLRLERSEAYRILARLRVLGLFGIQDDRSGARGGRYVWRTARDRGDRLEATRHRHAWARITAWARARRARILATITRSTATSGAGAAPAAAAVPLTAAAAVASFRDLLAAAGLPEATVRTWKRGRR